mgnify:CR=1 FL=1
MSRKGEGAALPELVEVSEESDPSSAKGEQENFHFKVKQIPFSKISS